MNKKINFKSKSFQIFFHILFWFFFLGFPFIFFNDDISIARLTEHLMRTFFLVLLFYTNSLIFIPKLLTKNKLWLYILAIIASIAFYIVLCILIDFTSQIIFFNPKCHPFYFIIPKSFFAALFIIGLSTSYKVTIKWFNAERQKKELENEKLASELAFLKSQINPHFLFNTLNNVYSLAYKKSDDTPDAILKLSKLMRYMLYESNENKVFLSKEIEYLHNYIDLQKLRLPSDFNIVFDINGEIENHLIEPMLLIPFVENAFKHGISYNENSRIHISIELIDNQLLFILENNIFNVNSSSETASGIGLTNVKRRLELLYPDKHNIAIDNLNDIFKITLIIFIEKC